MANNNEPVPGLLAAQHLNLNNFAGRVSTIMTALAALPQPTVDVLNGVECGHCAPGFGPFTNCVSVASYLSGSCTNCHFNSSGARCSLRAPLLPPEEEEGGEEKEEDDDDEGLGYLGPYTVRAPRDAATNRRNAARLHRLFIMAATSFDAAAAGLAAVAQACTVVADSFAEDLNKLDVELFDEDGDE
ncbi:hypothetical protein BJX63DRAFT_429710 [Aspergillus granulosus]|uniref:Uncharacterized protein n=1 Tax=Aspergillus granulosus TaxID=176169 RepID=A0ABR4HPA0_9EURO